MRKPKLSIGDLCEVKTPAGLAYIQYTHDGRDMAELVRILPGLYSVRPDIAALATEKELYFVYFTLEYALKEKDKFSIVSNQPVPDFAKALPAMRKRGHIDREGNTLFWYITQANKGASIAVLQQLPRIKTLSADQERLSIEALWPPPVMIRKLASGWLPERDEEFRLKAVAERDAAKESGVVPPQSAGPIEHYFYFPLKRQADEAAKLITEKGLQATVKKSADGESWLTLATAEPPNKNFDMEETREEFERLADRLGGEYDGWGMSVSRPEQERVQ